MVLTVCVSVVTVVVYVVDVIDVDVVDVALMAVPVVVLLMVDIVSLAVPPSGEVPATGRDVVPMDGTRTPNTKRQSKLEMSLAPSNSEISLRVGSVKREFSSPEETTSPS